MRPPTDISQYLPPVIRAALIRAAEIRNLPLIDRLTDEAAKSDPHLVLPRTTDRTRFAPRARLETLAQFLERMKEGAKA